MKSIPYGRQNIVKNDLDLVRKILLSDFITQGPKVDEFEKAFARYCGAKYAVAVSNGTAALHIASLAAGLKKGDEAVTTPITFVATPNSIIYAGAKPVFADIDHNTRNIDPKKIEKKITFRTKAIFPVHFAGLPCNMPEISKIAKKHSLTVVEDACHALGAKYKYKGEWVKVGSCRHSDMTVFSFHPVKHITTGEGGAITTNSRKLYDKLRALRSHGVYKSPRTQKNIGPWYYEMKDLGFNYRITDFQCALGISQLKRLNSFLSERRKIVRDYEKLFSEIDRVETPQDYSDAKSAWHIYPIKVKNASSRKKVFNFLRKNGIGVQVHYIPVHLQDYYRKNYGYKKGDYPEAEKYYAGAITLPLYPGMTAKDTKWVVRILKEAI